MTKKKTIKRKSVKRPSKTAKTVKKSSSKKRSSKTGNISQRSVKRKTSKTSKKEPNKAFPAWGEKFLKAFAKYGMKSRAAEACRVGRATVNNYIKLCPEFRDRMKEIDDEWTDDLERSALQRATYGSDDHVIFEGRVVYLTDEKGKWVRDENGDRIPIIKKKYETALTIFMLKARRRDRYLLDQMASNASAEEMAQNIRSALSSIEDSIPQP